MWVKGEIFRDLNDAAATARAMLTRERGVTLFDRFEWFERTAAHCPPPGRPLIARARAEGCDCWLFLAEQGGRATAYASWYALAFRPVFTGSPPPVVRRALLVAIARRLGKRLALIDLAPVSAEDGNDVAVAFRRAGWTTSMQATNASWTEQIDGRSFAAYWADRPGELRSTVKRKSAKAQIDIKVHSRFDAEGFAQFEDVYADSWKPDEGSPAFLRQMAEAEGNVGTLRLGIACHEGIAVAAQLWTIEFGTAIIHKLAHRTSAEPLSAGSLLTAAMFGQAIDVDKVTMMDFGTGDDRYKADWMTRRDPLYSLSMANLRTAAGLAAAARIGIASLARRLRSG